MKRIVRLGATPESALAVTSLPKKWRERIAEIKARADAATKGPWGYEESSAIGEGYYEIAPLSADGGLNWLKEVAATATRSKENAAFIAAARQDIPDLVAHIDELESALQGQRVAERPSAICIGKPTIERLERCETVELPTFGITLIPADGLLTTSTDAPTEITNTATLRAGKGNEMKDLRNALAKARDEWLESDRGLQCASGGATGQYLRNRLEMAFIAGWKAGESNRRKAATPIPALQGQVAGFEEWWAAEWENDILFAGYTEDSEGPTEENVKKIAGQAYGSATATLAAENERLRAALNKILDACIMADARLELPEEIDGAMTDEGWAALGLPAAKQGSGDAGGGK